jgi:pSer/pThr/pTyr-binding forkhead associated (FHA) protein
MKVQLVVVQGKPEGKTIPLVGPKFKIGRGEGCHLRPNSDLVSREHAEFEVAPDSVTVRDLGSRNGTDVNGKPLAKDQAYVLKNGDLVKIGSLTFAVSVEGVPVAKAASPAGSTKKSLDDVSHDEIDAWLVSDEARPTPDRPSGVYGGETITINSLNELGSKERPAAQTPTPAPAAKKPEPAPAAKKPEPAPAPAAKKPEPAPEPEPETVAEELEQYSPDEEDDGIEDLSKSSGEVEMPEEFIDESNPFYVKKKEAAPAAGAAKPSSKDSSDAAGDILRKMMDRRKASKS